LHIKSEKGSLVCNAILLCLLFRATVQMVKKACLLFSPSDVLVVANRIIDIIDQIATGLKFSKVCDRELPFINWAAFGAKNEFHFFSSQGYFWQVVEGVHRPALLNFTLFQSNIYKVNVREYPPRIYVVKTDNFELYDSLT